MDGAELVKENVLSRGPLGARWLALGVAAAMAALAGVALLDRALPEPLQRATAPSDRFIAEIAYEHLVNLTSIGPRVAGSYENEVVAVRVLVAAVREVAARAAPRHAIDVDLHTASGAFSIQFFDGLNNVYRSVQSVVVRVRGGAGAGAGRRAGGRSALLLNCHFDTVPDSPGASDDGAGCAVLLETLRALAASPRGLRHDVIFLFNGAEENILQASHAFITQHKWARTVRAFINIEACGAGGREVLFQAGPHDPWIMEVYAGAVPHPYASSVAQELFESGLVPSDTDFRIFRDFGNLSGVDLAWSANGYVYHTALDTARRVPPAALQRTGDNVLALAHGLLASEGLQSARDGSSRQPVFFDVVGQAMVSVRAPAAAAIALATLAALALRVHINACDASKHLYVSRGAWWRLVGTALVGAALSVCAGLAASGASALLLHATGRRLAYYSSDWLVGPLLALPGACGAGGAARAWARRTGRRGGAGVLVRGSWWGARAWADALALLWGLLLAACAARGLRSGFVPLLWALLPTAADGAAALAGARPPHRAALWCLAGALPMALTWSLALGAVGMLLPVAGRAGTASVPPDLLLALLVTSLTLAAVCWLLPLLIATRSVKVLMYAGVCASCVSMALVQGGAVGAPYSAARPQRFMVFHVRRTVHAAAPAPAPAPAPGAPAPPELLYWLPELDVNTPHSVDMYVAGMREARPARASLCRAHPYCGAPYYLPVLGLVARGHELPAHTPPLARLSARLALTRLNDTVQLLRINVTGPSHVVAIVAPAAGARVSWCSALDAPPVEAARWGDRRTYFFTLHDARRPAPWLIEMHIQHSFRRPLAPGQWVAVSLAGHSLSGEQQRQAAHAALLASFPPWAATTGWGVDLHLYDL